MDTGDVQVGSTIKRGAIAVRITDRVNAGPDALLSGWRGLMIPLEPYGGVPGASVFVADCDMERWCHVPFEWRVTPDGAEERYVWEPCMRRLRRQVQRTAL